MGHYIIFFFKKSVSNEWEGWSVAKEIWAGRRRVVTSKEEIWAGGSEGQEALKKFR